MPGVQDRIALVTGAGQGIGAAIAARLAAGGAKVAVLDLTEANTTDTVEALVDRADQAMYESKRLGRNRASLFAARPGGQN